MGPDGVGSVPDDLREVWNGRILFDAFNLYFDYPFFFWNAIGPNKSVAYGAAETVSAPDIVPTPPLTVQTCSLDLHIPPLANALPIDNFLVEGALITLPFAVEDGSRRTEDALA